MPRRSREAGSVRAGEIAGIAVQSMVRLREYPANQLGA
jgi:hypothetical protein